MSDSVEGTPFNQPGVSSDPLVGSEKVAPTQKKQLPDSTIQRSQSQTGKSAVPDSGAPRISNEWSETEINQKSKNTVEIYKKVLLSTLRK